MILKQPPNVPSVKLSDFLRAMGQNMDQVSASRHECCMLCVFGSQQQKEVEGFVWEGRVRHVYFNAN